ncbi:unnamed protein product [Ambrosiozyma monospora]|uniref:Unnamed protein product n=1 Tax=Ambrosiozyma monospora TaxID=43982 RepID=A0ACB5UAD5_AMBMO|nr:unnamed protein product [Ambrosiozyma monospora]
MSPGDILVGVKLTVSKRLDSIQFRSSSGKFSGYYGRYNFGAEHDICFNDSLKALSGTIGHGIESIRFHW